MTWGAVGGAAVSVIGGSLLGGGSKKAERSAKDSAANAKYLQEALMKQTQAQLSPFITSGQEANRELSRLLGIDTTGYGIPKPELQDFLDKERNDHFNKYGKDYGRQANTVGAGLTAKSNYNQALSAWQKGLDEYKKANADNGNMGSGSLLKAFSNEDFEKDPGYEFRQAEGEKGIQRQLAKMGGFNSGAALKAIDRYNQDYASNEFSNAYNRDAANKARTFSFLSDTANKGLQATGTGVAVNQGATNANSQIQSNLGNNLAGMYQQNADNQSNMFQSAVGNALYAYERNKPVTGQTTVPSGGYSSAPAATKPWYLS